jgi:hypothetical protein
MVVVEALRIAAAALLGILVPIRPMMSNGKMINPDNDLQAQTNKIGLAGGNLRR